MNGGGGHSLSTNPAHNSLDGRVVIEWVHEDDCLVTALTCTAFRDFVRDIHKKRKEMKGSTHSGRITTLSAGVVSSLDRFLWVRSSFPGEKAPPWLIAGIRLRLPHREARAAGRPTMGSGARMPVE